VLEDAACLEGPAQEEEVWPLDPAVEGDRECSVDIFVLFVAVWRCDGGLGGELAVIGDLWSIASLCVLEGGLGQLALLLR